MSPPEKEHIVAAFSFELTKVNRPEIRERVLTGMLANIDADLTASVAANLGMPVPARNGRSRAQKNGTTQSSPALSQLKPAREPMVKGRKVAIVADRDADAQAISALQTALATAGVDSIILADRIGPLNGSGLQATQTLATMPSVAFDAVAVAVTADAAAASGDIVHYVNEAYKHGKPIAFASDDLVEEFDVDTSGDGTDGIAISSDPTSLANELIASLAKHRFFEREVEAVPA